MIGSLYSQSATGSDASLKSRPSLSLRILFRFFQNSFSISSIGFAHSGSILLKKYETGLAPIEILISSSFIPNLSAKFIGTGLTRTDILLPSIREHNSFAAFSLVEISGAPNFLTYSIVTPSCISSSGYAEGFGHFPMLVKADIYPASLLASKSCTNAIETFEGINCASSLPLVCSNNLGEMAASRARLSAFIRSCSRRAVSVCFSSSAARSFARATSAFVSAIFLLAFAVSAFAFAASAMAALPLASASAIRLSAAACERSEARVPLTVDNQLAPTARAPEKVAIKSATTLSACHPSDVTGSNLIFPSWLWAIPAALWGAVLISVAVYTFLRVRKLVGKPKR